MSNLFNLNILKEQQVVFQSFTTIAQASSETAAEVFSDSMDKMGEKLKVLNAPGVGLGNEMVRLSLLTGKGVDELKAFEENARQTAITFGGTAAESLQLYNTLISRLGEQLVDHPEALKIMGNQVILLSKAMSIDQAEALDQITEKMELYGISMEDPTEAAWAMASMVEGSSEIMDRAGLVMDTFTEKENRLKAQTDDLVISFTGTGDSVFTWLSLITTGIQPLTDFIALQESLKKVLPIVSNNIGTGWKTLKEFNTHLATGQIESLGFLKNIGRALVGVLRFATVGLYHGIVALGSYGLALISGEQKCLEFAIRSAISFNNFKKSAVSACRAVGVAIGNIPIIGWIGIALTGLFALGAYFYKTSDKFRDFIDGIWTPIKGFFTNVGEFAIRILGGVGDLFRAAFSFDWDGIKEAIKKMSIKNLPEQQKSAGKTAYSPIYQDAFNKKTQKDKGFSFTGTDYSINIPDYSSPGFSSLEEIDNEVPALFHENGLEGSFDYQSMVTGGMGGSKHINVTIEKLVEKFEIHTTNLQEDLSRVKDMVAGALEDAVNDLNYAY